MKQATARPRDSSLEKRKAPSNSVPDASGSTRVNYNMLLPRAFSIKVARFYGSKTRHKGQSVFNKSCRHFQLDHHRQERSGSFERIRHLLNSARRSAHKGRELLLDSFFTAQLALMRFPQAFHFSCQSFNTL